VTVSLTGIVLTARKRERSTGRSTSGKRDASFATGRINGTESAPEFRAQARLPPGRADRSACSVPPPRSQSSQIPNDDPGRGESDRD